MNGCGWCSATQTIFWPQILSGGLHLGRICCQQMILVFSRLTENLGLDLNGPLLKTIVQVSESFGIIWNGFCNIYHNSLNWQDQIDMWTHNACSQECLKHFSSILIDSLHIQIVSKEAVFSRSLIEFSICEFEFQFWTDRPGRLLNWRRKKYNSMKLQNSGNKIHKMSLRCHKQP